MMGFFTKSYFIRSLTGKTDGTSNENWTIATLPFFGSITAYVNKYRYDLENEHGGTCMITELRRV